MQPARATWTDERLDDLSKRLDRGFDTVGHDIRDLRAEIGSRDEALRVEMHRGDEELAVRMGKLQRTVNLFGSGIMLTLLGGFLTLIVGLLTLWAGH